MKLFYLTDLPLKNKTVFVRVDYNVPLKGTKIQDNTRIKASLPTLRYLLQKNCKLVLATHLGRPQGKFIPELKTNPLAKELARLLNHKVIKLTDCLGPEIKTRIEKGQPGDIFFLENLRFYKEEEENDLLFAHSLANLADFYLNAAFAVSHRKHASVDQITKFIPSAWGFLLKKEITQLSKALQPKRPSVWIIGGTKLDKIDLINNAFKKADHLLIGGALAFSFLKAKGYQVGMSKTDLNSIKIAKKILKNKKAARKIILPLDITIASNFKTKAKTVSIDQIPTDQAGFDIGPKSIQLFQSYLKKAKTVVWNGPLGVFEHKPFHKGTKAIAQFVSKLKATTLIGGGETAEAINKFKLTKKMTHVSTGGGAALTFLSGKKLPALQALEKNYQKFKNKI